MSKCEVHESLSDIWKSIIQVRPESESFFLALRETLGSDKQPGHERLPNRDGIRRDTYLLRFVLPLAELAGWPDRDTPHLRAALLAHYEWCWVWRHLDNLLDSAAVVPDELATLAITCSRATRIYAAVFGSAQCEGHWIEVEKLLQRTCLVAEEERDLGLQPARIWERAAPFLIVPRTLLSFGPSEEGAYCSYISMVGLLHDVHDLAKDLRLGIKSAPILWLEEADRDITFRPDVLHRWFKRAAHEVRLCIDAVRAYPPVAHCEVLNALLEEAQECVDEF